MATEPIQTNKRFSKDQFLRTVLGKLSQKKSPEARRSSTVAEDGTPATSTGLATTAGIPKAPLTSGEGGEGETESRKGPLIGAKEEQRGLEIVENDSTQNHQSPQSGYDLADGIRPTDESRAVQTQTLISSFPPEEETGLWDAAYDGLREQDPDLLDGYEKMLSSYLIRGDDETQFRKHEIAQTDWVKRRAQMAKVVEVWLSDGEEESRSGDDTEDSTSPSQCLRGAIRNLVERASHASIVWAATCLSIEELVNHGPLSETSNSGIVYVTSRLEWYISLSRLLTSKRSDLGASLSSATSQAEPFQAGLVSLYQAILFYQIRTACSRHETMVSSQPLDNGQPGIDIARLEQVLATGSTGQEVEAQLRRLLEADAFEQEDMGQEHDPAEESQEDTNSTELLGMLHVTHQPLPPLEGDEGRVSNLLYRWAASTSEYRDWNEDGSCQVLWVAGDAGTGKTTLLQATVRKLSDDSSKRVAYFFCSSKYGSWRETSVVQIVKSLIWQVLKSQPNLQLHLDTKISSTGRKVFDGPNDFYAMATLLCAILEDSNFEPMYFVVDAMEDLCDELDDHRDFDSISRDPFAEQWGPKDLVRLIVETSKLSDRVRWLVSICHTGVTTEIVERQGCLGAAERTDKSGSIRVTHRCLRIDPALEGVRLAADEYASLKLEQLAKKTTYGGTLQTQVTQTLQRLSPGNFLWVDMACDAIESSGVPWKAPSILRGLKGDLAALNSQVKAGLDKLDDDDKGRCKTVLSTAAIAFRSLSVFELASIVDLPHEVDLGVLIERMCSAFLEVREDKVCFTNLSARDYLRRDLIQEGTLSLTHSYVIKQCLRVALKSYPPPEDKDEPRLVDYAAVYWIRHLVKIDADELRNAMEPVNDFLKSQFLPWLETLSSHHLLLKQALSDLQILEAFLVKKIPPPSNNEPGSLLFQHVRVAILVLHYHQSSHSPAGLSPRNSLLFCPRPTELRQMLPPEELRNLTETLVVEPTGWGLDACLHVLKGHSDWVRDCTFTPDGRLVVTASDDGTVRLWDTKTGTAQHVIDGRFSGYVYHVAICPSGPGLLAATDSSTIHLWHVSTGKFEKRLEAPDNITEEEDPESEVSRPSIEHITFSPSGDALVATTSKSVIVWHLPSYRRSVLIDSGKDESETIFGCVGFSNDGRLLAWSTWNDLSDAASIVVWDMDTWTVRHKLDSSRLVGGVAFSPDSTLLASQAYDGNVRIWDVSKGTQLQEIAAGWTGGGCVRFSPDGRRLAAISDESVTIWKAARPGDPELFQCEKILKEYSTQVYAISFSPDGRHMVSSSRDTKARVWRVDDDVSTGVKVDVNQVPNGDSPTQKGHTQSISFVAFSPNGTMVASASLDGLIVLWDANEGTQLHSFVGHDSDIKYLLFSNKGDILISASSDFTVGVWDTKTGNRTHRLEGHVDWVRGAAISPKDQFVASASDDGTVRVWDLDATDTRGPEDGEDQPVQPGIRVLSSHKDYVYCVAFSPDGRYLASGGDERRILLWDLAEDEDATDDNQEQQPHKALRDDEKLGDYVRALVFSPPDGLMLVSATRHGTVGLWNTHTGQCVWSVSADDEPRLKLQQPRMLSIDPRFPDVLLTEFGALLGGLLEPEPPALLPTLPPWWPYGVRMDHWIREKDRNIIFLPEQARPSEAGPCTSCVHSGRVVVGCESGQVLIFKFCEALS